MMKEEGEGEGEGERRRRRRRSEEIRRRIDEHNENKTKHSTEQIIKTEQDTDLRV
jgi:hypothetical protein